MKFHRGLVAMVNKEKQSSDSSWLYLLHLKCRIQLGLHLQCTRVCFLSKLQIGVTPWWRRMPDDELDNVAAAGIQLSHPMSHLRSDVEGLRGDKSSALKCHLRPCDIFAPSSLDAPKSNSRKVYDGVNQASLNVTICVPKHSDHLSESNFQWTQVLILSFSFIGCLIWWYHTTIPITWFIPCILYCAPWILNSSTAWTFTPYSLYSWYAIL